MRNSLDINPEAIPFGPGPGAINGLNPADIRSKFMDICRSPAGLFYYGSLTPQERFGNKGETYYHDPITGKTVNSMGLPNLGIDNAKDIMIFGQQVADDNGKEFIVSVSAAPGEDPSQVLPMLASKVLDAGVRRVEVNYSCPNKVATDGVSREPVLGYDIVQVLRTRERIFSVVGDDTYVIEKWPPYLSEDLPKNYSAELREMFDFLLNSKNGRKVGGIALSNTIMGIDLKQDDGTHALDIVSTATNGDITHSHVGGMSGPYVAETMREELEEAAFRTQWREIDLISAGGVDNGREVLRRKLRGAVASIGVTTFWEGEKVGRSFGRTVSVIAEEYWNAA
jgi:dihydroorotate dehydrogenase